MDRANTDTEPKYQKWQYRYGHQVMSVLVMYHANTGIGQKCKYANTGTGTIYLEEP